MNFSQKFKAKFKGKQIRNKNSYDEYTLHGIISHQFQVPISQSCF